MFLVLKDNICTSVSEFEIDEASLEADEQQIEVPESELLDDMEDMLGKQYIDGRFEDPPKTDEEQIMEESAFYMAYLLETDWKVTRHRDQLELGIETSLTTEEFSQLLQERQEARSKVIIPDPPEEET